MLSWVLASLLMRRWLFERACGANEQTPMREQKGALVAMKEAVMTRKAYAHTVLGAPSGTDARVCRVPPRGRPARAHTGAATTAVSFPSAVAATKIDAVAGDDDLGDFSSNPTTGSLRPPTRCIGWPWNGPNQLRPRRRKVTSSAGELSHGRYRSGGVRERGERPGGGRERERG